MRVRAAVPLALLALLFALSACGTRKRTGVDAAAGGPGPVDTAVDVMPSGPDVGDTGASASGGAGGALALDARADVAVDVDGEADGGRAPDGPADQAGGDVPCGSPTDPKNCGTCGHDCTALYRVRVDRVQCQNGACVIPSGACRSGYGNCSGDVERGCDYEVFRPARCGCGVSCPTPGDFCATPADGPPTCVATCDGTGLTACDRECVDLQNNERHCGACGARCVIPHAVPACIAGRCGISQCSAGYGQCHPSELGCDTILGTFYDCRRCDDSCAAMHAIGSCGASGCTRTCHAGYGDCDTSSSDCETPLDTAANCGTCGTICPRDRPLCGGPRGEEICRATCAAPWPDTCGTSCTDLQSDPRHCGACGTVCEAYQACERGRCTPRYVKTDVLVAPNGASASSVVMAPDGAYYVRGMFTGTTDLDPGPGQDIRTVVSSSDDFISRFEADGSYAWTRTWPMDLSVSAVAPDGSVIATGSFSGTIDFDPGPATLSMSAGGSWDAFVLKLTASGDLAWANVFAGTPESEGGGLARHATLAADGHVYVVGTFSGEVDLDPGSAIDRHRAPQQSLLDAFVVKLTPSGSFAWARVFGGGREDNAMTIAVDASGLLWIGGKFAGTTDLDPGAGVDAHTASDAMDGFVVRWDSAGTFRDSRIYDQCVEDGVTSISFDGSGSAYVGGLCNDRASPISTSTGFVQKLGPGGDELWLHRRLGMYLPAAAPDGGVLFLGTGIETEPGMSGFLAGKLDRDGKPVWTIPAPPVRHLARRGLAADATKLIVVGSASGRAVDFDPGAGTDRMAPVGAVMTRFAF